MKLLKSHLKSNARNVLAGHFGKARIVDGALVTILVSLSGMNSPMMVNAAIEMINAPGMRRTTTTGVSRIPKSVRMTDGFFNEPIAM